MESYLVNINNFEGPLDLLLHLIRCAEIDICDIFVSEITSQYLAYMDQIGNMDMDRASEFLTMAATLLYIKSRQLLPRPAEETDAPGEESPEQTLIKQLQDYKAFKEAGESFRELMEQASASMTRLPEDIVLPPAKVELKDTTTEGLYAAFLKMMERVEHAEKSKKTRQVKHDSFTIRRQTTHIRNLLKNAGKPVDFYDLFSEKPVKMEVIVTFMAVLEMIARGEIHVAQKKTFAPILLESRNLLDKDSDISYMDEMEETENG